MPKTTLHLSCHYQVGKGALEPWFLSNKGAHSDLRNKLRTDEVKKSNT